MRESNCRQGSAFDSDSIDGVRLGNPVLPSASVIANRRAEICFALGREHWGRGLMQEALVAPLGYAFDTLNLHRFEADVDPRNAASLRLPERLGFVREGLLRERWLVGGAVQDSVILGLLRREWSDGRPPSS